MKSLKSKKKNKILHSKFLLVFLIVLFFLAVYSAYGAYDNYIESKALKNEYKEELVSLEEKKDSLLKEIDRFNSQRGMEEVIRDKFRYGKDGEGLIVIVDDDDQEGLDKKEPENDSRFDEFLNLFR